MESSNLMEGGSNDKLSFSGFFNHVFNFDHDNKSNMLDVKSIMYNKTKTTEMEDLYNQKIKEINENIGQTERLLEENIIKAQIMDISTQYKPYELYLYKMIGLFLSYSISYITRPKRIIRTIKSVFTDKSSSVAEQRFKDNLRRSVLFTKYIKPFVTKVFFRKENN